MGRPKDVLQYSLMKKDETEADESCIQLLHLLLQAEQQEKKSSHCISIKDQLVALDPFHGRIREYQLTEKKNLNKAGMDISLCLMHCQRILQVCNQLNKSRCARVPYKKRGSIRLAHQSQIQCTSSI